jgi:Mg-chelatase subunit ChlD
MTSDQGTDDWTLSSTAESASFVDVTNVDEPKDATEVLKLSVSPKHKLIGIKCADTWTSACVSIQASDMPENYEDKTSALDVTVALDISGSMTGQKLTDCISTLESMLRPLGPKHRFGLVAFGSAANVVIPASFMTKESKKAALRKIKALRTRDCTNLSGGLTLAWQEMMLIDTPNAVRSVFLLTDGQANEGVTDTSSLVTMVKSFNSDSGPDYAALSRMNVGESNNDSKIPAAIALDNKGAPVSLFCFGYGSDHNSEMLRAISEVTPGGAYYFVENDSDVSTAFGDAMGGLLSVTAQSAVLKLSVPPPAAAMGVKIRDIHHDEKVDRGDGSYTVSLGDFYAEESRDVVFDVDLSNVPSDAPVPHVHVSLFYMDILKRKTTQAGPVECSIARPDSAQVAPVDLHVESQWLRVCTVREMEAADLEAQQNQLGLAQDRLKKVEESIYKSPAYNSENALLMALESNVKAIRTNFQSTSSYDNVGGHQSKNIYNSLRRQRAMVSSEASAAPYQTSRKKKMANAFSRSTQK